MAWCALYAQKRKVLTSRVVKQNSGTGSSWHEQMRELAWSAFVMCWLLVRDVQ